MHDPFVENYERGYEWGLLVEAKKRNPAIKTYGLSWAFPQWISCNPGTLSNCSSSPYTHREQTAGYITKFVTGLKKTYGITLDFVGSWSHHSPSHHIVSHHHHIAHFPPPSLLLPPPSLLPH